MSKLSKNVPLIAIAVIALALALAGCGSKKSSSAQSDAGIAKTASGSSGATSSSAAIGNTVDADLNEWSIKTKQPVVKAGKVTFKATNSGAALHELVVLKTDKPADSLGNKARVSEKDSVGEVPDVASGKTKSNTLNLKPGKYVLICNINGHYMQGMRTSLTVK
jgi:uncharacterized cupredoxin-like copper-binding protein